MPFKSVAISFTDARGRSFARKGEFVATATGVEGSLVYAASALLRDEIAAQGSATLLLDLLPDRSAEQVRAAVLHPRGSRSLASHLKSRLGLEGIKTGVLHEVLARERDARAREAGRDDQGGAAAPGRAAADRRGDQHRRRRALRCARCAADGSALPGVFCAGEMLDWEAPTGGYLLTARMASGAAAARACCCDAVA